MCTREPGLGRRRLTDQHTVYPFHELARFWGDRNGWVFFCFVLKVIECNVEYESETIRIVHWPLMFDVDNVVMI